MQRWMFVSVLVCTGVASVLWLLVSARLIALPLVPLTIALATLNAKKRVRAR
jgi:hypothetical protein